MSQMSALGSINRGDVVNQCFILKLVTVAIWIAFTSNALAVSEFIPVGDRAQGQSLTAASLMNDSIYTNPASSAFTQVYAVEGIYQAPKSFGVSVLDTRTSELGGGLGYFRSDVGFEKPLQGVKLSLGGRASSIIGVGLAGKMLWGPDRTGADNKLNDVDTGIVANLMPLQLGLTFRNVFGGNAAMELNREWALGARLAYEDLLYLSFSAVSTFSKVQPYQYGIGMEYVSPYFFSLKGGLRLRPSESLTFWSAGASILAPKVNLHYVAEFPAQPGKSVEHTIAATFLF